eukprot:m.329229 g.329229  ORF g.329229 m.329229 type:complete len:78 (+) comp19757_c0_seq11:3501-3734(+)
MDFGNLLSVEAAPLLCVVPTFCRYIGHDGDQGLMQLLQVATRDREFSQQLLTLVKSSGQQQAWCLFVFLFFRGVLLS